MNVLNSILSLTKEPPYLIKILKSGDTLKLVREISVRGNLSIHNEKTVDSMGDLYDKTSYQFICQSDIKSLLTPEEEILYNAGDLDFWLIDVEGREIRLTKTNSYLNKTGILSPFRSVVYKGRIENV